MEIISSWGFILVERGRFAMGFIYPMLTISSQFISFQSRSFCQGFNFSNGVHFAVGFDFAVELHFAMGLYFAKSFDSAKIIHFAEVLI